MFQRKLELIRTLETLTLIKECCDLFNSFLDKNSTDKKKLKYWNSVVSSVSPFNLCSLIQWPVLSFNF
jgi:hypothetical protein